MERVRDNVKIRVKDRVRIELGIGTGDKDRYRVYEQGICIGRRNRGYG